MSDRYQDATRVVGGSTMEVIKNTKVFMCGAGGIGCELLKCLILAGFRDIEMIDMDTVDSSNLNRQFLFRPQHVDKPKSEVARETALRYNPSISLKAHYGNVKDSQYDVPFFAQFGIIVNGLDNRSARSHVNRMAMKAGVPLIESGTMGFNGQVQPILKDVTQCYDCNPKQAGQVSFAVCTIHQKPSSMVHCTHYAKELYKRFFGEQVDTDPELADLMEAADFTQAELPTEGIIAVFDKIFSGKVEDLIALKAAGYTDENRPRPITFSSASEIQTTSSTTTALKSQRVLGINELASNFVSFFKSLHKREQQNGEKLAWDKDDAMALGFTVAVSNLRAYNFNIAMESEFSIKSIAGSIIPAIATSNAVISGGIVLEAIKVITKQTEKVRIQSLRRFPARVQRKDCYIVPEKPPALNPKCMVCQYENNGRNFLKMRLNLNATTIGFIARSVCENELALPHPMISLIKGEEEKVLYEDEEMTHNSDRALAEFVDMEGGDMGRHNVLSWALLIEDMMQELVVEITLTHAPELSATEFVLKPQGEEEKIVLKTGDKVEQQDSAIEVDSEDEVMVFHPKKLNRQGEAAGGAAAADVVELDDEEPQMKRRKIA